MGEAHGEKGFEVPPESRKRRNPFLDTKEDRERRQKKRARVIVRNISYFCNEEEIKNHFAQFGQVEEVNLLKRNDGKLVGCAFVQFEAINYATKAILKGNGSKIKGREVYVDWAVGKDQYKAKNNRSTTEVKTEEVKIEESDEILNGDGNDASKDDTRNRKRGSNENNSDSDNSATDEEIPGEESDNEEKGDIDSDNRDIAESGDSDTDDNDIDEDEKNDSILKDHIEKVKKQRHVSNDVKEGCTVFLKNIHFDAEDQDLRKLCRKYGPLHYAIINRESISGHSKGTAFVKFKSCESAALCLQAGNELILMDQVIETFPAMSREEIRNQENKKSKSTEGKDSRNLYLAREGLIMSGSKAAEGVSASDMAKRHELERIKTQVLKNLNRFVSRNRLSVHNLPASYDNEKLRQMAITYTGFKPHECRVMRENKITAEHPKGKSKGFGFLSFSTHQDALSALRKLNNNPKIFSNEHRPIVAFSIEDRAVHKVKEKRKLKSKLNNPTYKEKLEKRQEAKKQQGKRSKPQEMTMQQENKQKIQQKLKMLETRRNNAANNNKSKNEIKDNTDDFLGTAAKPGTALRMRSNKKINEQAKEHMKKVREKKRKEKQRKIRKIHLAERKTEIRPKQGRKIERDNLENLLNKYKNMISGSDTQNSSSAKLTDKKIKTKRKKWYTGD